MDDFQYRGGELFCEEVPLQGLADEYGTPVYVYSRNTFRRHLSTVFDVFGELNPQVCYAIKSCGNIHLLREVADLGGGADVVSGGELYRAQLAGIPAEQVVFAGVGKSEQEIQDAIEMRIGCVNVESEAELQTLSAMSTRLGQTMRVAIRVNPDVEGYNTPQKTTTGVRGSKFGIDIERVPELFDRSKDLQGVQLVGVHIHLGSPIYSPEPYRRALLKIVDLVRDLERRGHEIETINMGGGFAAHYQTDEGPTWSDYAAAVVPILKPFVEAGGRVLIEPGRSISANSGVLLTRVRYVKEAGNRRVAVVDAGMGSLIRFVLYDSFHFIWPVQPAGGLVPPRRTEKPELSGLAPFDIAGPICESSDYLARGRDLPALAEGDLLCVFTAGAYGMVMSSQYNAVPRPAEVLVDAGQARLIRRRETYADLVEAELAVAEPVVEG